MWSFSMWMNLFFVWTDKCEKFHAGNKLSESGNNVEYTIIPILLFLYTIICRCRKSTPSDELITLTPLSSPSGKECEQIES